MNKKILVIIVLIGILEIVLIGLLVSEFISYWHLEKTYEAKMRKISGEAQIVVYKKGEKIVLDANSPYFKELQLVCEEMLWNAVHGIVGKEILEEDFPPHPEEVRNNEWAIELFYSQPQSFFRPSRTSIFGFSRPRGIPAELSHVLIPLTGKLAHYQYAGEKYTYLFPFRKETYPILEKKGGCVPSFSTESQVQKIKEILKKFDIEIP